MKTFRNILFVFFGMQASIIYAQSQTNGNLVSEMAVEIVVADISIDNPGQLTQQGPIKDVFKTKNGQILKFTYNSHRQLVAGKRIGGVELQLAYPDAGAKSPSAIKIGNRRWILASEIPAITSAPSFVEGLTIDQIIDMASLEDSKLLAPKSSLVGPDDIQAGSPEDENKKKTPLSAEEWRQILEWIEASFTGGGGGGGDNGYCQSVHCSFPSLGACLADCEGVRSVSQIVCGGVGILLTPASGLACLAVTELGYFKICLPRCNAGIR